MHKNLKSWAEKQISATDFGNWFVSSSANMGDSFFVSYWFAVNMVRATVLFSDQSKCPQVLILMTEWLDLATKLKKMLIKNF